MFFNYLKVTLRNLKGHKGYSLINISGLAVGMACCILMLLWVLISNLIAWPAAFFIMNQWLQNFAYRISIGFETFLLAGLMTLGIALLTVGFQTVKAACANPVKSLRYE